MRCVPHPYQRYCEDRIVAEERLGLFLDMGLGKTMITLRAVNRLLYDELAAQKVLIIAPKKVAEATWQAEAQKWDDLRPLRFSTILGTKTQRAAALARRADVYVINRDNVEWLADYLYRELKMPWPFDMVVCDESSSFKNPSSGRFRALKAQLPHISRVVLLTGTPAPNGVKGATDNLTKIETLRTVLDGMTDNMTDGTPWETFAAQHADAIKQVSDGTEMVIESYDDLANAQAYLMTQTDAADQKQTESADALLETYDTITKAMDALNTERENYADGSDEYIAASQSIASLEQLQAQIDHTIASYYGYSAAQAAADKAAKTGSKATTAAAATLDDYRKSVDKATSDKKRLNSALADVSAWKKQGAAAGDFSEVLQKYPDIFTDVGMSYDQAAALLTQKNTEVDGALSLLSQNLQAKLADLQAQASAAYIANPSITGTATANIDTSAIEAEIEKVKALIAALAAYGVSVGGGGGGGGGGKSKYQKDVAEMENKVKLEKLTTQQQLDFLLSLQKKYKKLSADDAQDLAERLHDIREQLRKEQYQADMDLYEHQKAMGELTVSQEIDALETIKKAHELKQEEIWSIDEKLYTLRQQAVEEAAKKEEDTVTNLYDDIVDALQKRYEEQREIEKQALSDRISALEAEQSAQDEARAVQDYLLCFYVLCYNRSCQPRGGCALERAASRLRAGEQEAFIKQLSGPVQQLFNRCACDPDGFLMRFFCAALVRRFGPPRPPRRLSGGKNKLYVYKTALCERRFIYVCRWEKHHA